MPSVIREDSSTAVSPADEMKRFLLSHQNLRKWVVPFGNALFPPRCLICGAFHNPGVKGRDEEINSILCDGMFLQLPMGALFIKILSVEICPTCVAGWIPLVSPLCHVCGIMFTGRQGVDHPCPECDGKSRAFHQARAVGAYESQLMEAVHRLKYEGKTQLAGPLGLLMFVVFCRIWEKDPVDMILTVPLHHRRLRRRGFNQAHLLVRDWPRYALLSGLPGFEFEIAGDVLVRTRWSRPQIGLRREDRRANVKGAFAVKNASRISGKTLLLVDDVHTTGSTVEACAKALTRSGARRVDVFTLARAL